MVTKKILIKGKVQGVFYRKSARDKALENGISGTAKNLADKNSVEIMATGNNSNLAAFIEWCKSGPARASVSMVEVFEAPYQQFNGFQIL